MNFDISSVFYDFYNLLLSSPYLLLTLALYLGFIYFLWRVVICIYEVSTTITGIQYVENKPREIQMNTAIRNPFYFQVDFATASFSGVKCVMKCDGVCYVQALWGVPIYSLVECLNKDWFKLLSSITSLDPSEKFSSKCTYASNPFVLADNVERIIEFELPSHIDRAAVSDSAAHSRTIYPFVVLMVLTKRNKDISKYPDPFAIASASALHLPGNAFKSTFIAQFIRLSSGHVGQMKKIYRSSGTEEEMSDTCLICFHRPISVVQLSCRHFCVCRNCYLRCDKCPLCRNSYMDFFDLNLYPESDFSPQDLPSTHEDINH